MRRGQRERQRRVSERREQTPRLWALCGIRRQLWQRGRRWRRERVGSEWDGGMLVRLLSRTQRHKLRDECGSCQLVRLLRRTQLHIRRVTLGRCQLVCRSAKIYSERARGRRQRHTLKRATVQCDLGVLRLWRVWRRSTTSRVGRRKLA